MRLIDPGAGLAEGKGGPSTLGSPPPGQDDEPDIRVRPIRDGTVIDHIPPGLAFAVLSILGITSGHGSVVSVVMNVQSKALGGRKDIVKIEARELEKREIDKIALIAPLATINIIRGFKVAKKYKVKLPEVLEGILACPNPNCISNQKEPVAGKSIVESREPLVVTCYYCGKKHLDIIGEIRK